MFTHKIQPFYLAFAAAASIGCSATQVPPRSPSAARIEPKRELAPKGLGPRSCQELRDSLVAGLTFPRDRLFQWDLSQALYFATHNVGVVRLDANAGHKILKNLVAQNGPARLSNRLRTELKLSKRLEIRCGAGPLEKISPWTLPTPGIISRVNEPPDQSQVATLIERFGVSRDKREDYLQGRLLTQHNPSEARSLILLKISRDYKTPLLSKGDRKLLGYLQDRYFYYMAKTHSPYVRRYFFIRALQVLQKRFDSIVKSFVTQTNRFHFVKIPHHRKFDLLTLLSALRHYGLAYVVVEGD